MVVSVLRLKTELTHVWQSFNHDSNDYRHSPGCVPTASDVDPRLTPCQNIPVQVTAKSRRVEHIFKRSYGYRTQNHNILTLQDAYHQTRNVYEVNDRLWDAVAIGDTATVQVWRQGRITYMTAKGERSVVFDGSGKPNRSIQQIQLWTCLFFFSLVSLGILRFIPSGSERF